MDQFLEKVMNFINENTMLLILICIFLIVILVIYLIDNTIKTKRLEQEEANKQNNAEQPVVLNNEPSPNVESPKVEEVPVEPVIEEPIAPVIPEAAVEPVEETPKVEETPVIDSNIEELLNKDYSNNNAVVENIPNEPVIETPKVEEAPKSKYNNDKKLSDIFGKKEEKPSPKVLETTQDFSDELDRILKKLNNEEDNSSLEDTSNYSNMF